MNKQSDRDKNEINKFNSNDEMTQFVKDFSLKLEMLENKLDKQVEQNEKLKNYNDVLENKLINSKNE